MSIVGTIRWSQRQKLARLARKSHDANIVRRALTLSGLARGQAVLQVAEALCAARSTIYQWAGWFRDGSIGALCQERRGRERRTLTEDVLREFEALLTTTPQALGYLRSRWNSELLARELRAHTGVNTHPSTVRRALSELDWVWRRAQPTLHIADPRKKQRLRSIRRALATAQPGVGVFFQDGVDIDPNPRIGPAWRQRGRAHQETLPRRARTERPTSPGPCARAPARWWCG